MCVWSACSHNLHVHICGETHVCSHRIQLYGGRVWRAGVLFYCSLLRQGLSQDLELNHPGISTPTQLLCATNSYYHNDMKTTENKSKRMQFYSPRKENKMAMILFLDTNEIMQPRFSAGTSHEDCDIYSHEDSVSGQSRLRLPHGSPRDVHPPALCPSRSTLSRLLSWC